MTRAIVFAVVVLVGGDGFAQKAERPAPTPTPTPTTSSEMNFDLFGDKNRKSPLDEAREQERIAELVEEVHLRRQLLKWHQALGFVTLVALAATDIIGQLNYQDKFVS